VPLKFELCFILIQRYHELRAFGNELQAQKYHPNSTKFHRLGLWNKQKRFHGWSAPTFSEIIDYKKKNNNYIRRRD
jgi:hypothetical protein